MIESVSLHMNIRTKEVKVSKLRRKLAQYLAGIGRGERLRVISRGKVIAEIRPPCTPEDEADAARSRLRGSVLRYQGPLDPVVAPKDWHANR